MLFPTNLRRGLFDSGVDSPSFAKESPVRLDGPPLRGRRFHAPGFFPCGWASSTETPSDTASFCPLPGFTGAARMALGPPTEAGFPRLRQGDPSPLDHNASSRDLKRQRPF